MGKRNQKKANGAGVYWVRAAVILLIIYVAKLTISYCSSVYYDREALYQGALNCSLQVLRKHGVDHWLQNGTLLGSTRLGRLVLWDADLDIGFVRSESNEKHGALLQDLDSVCFGPRSDFILGAKYPLKIYRKCNERICAEFYEALVKDGSVITSDGISSQRELFPLKNCTVANIIAQCPHNSSFYLKEAYAKDRMSVKGSIWLGTPLVEGSSDCDSPFTSKIGGSAMLFRETSDYSAFRCPKCKGINNVSLLAQIYAPLDVYDRIVYVFLCAYCSKGGSSYCFVLRSQNFNPSYVHTSPGSPVDGDCGGAVFAENDDWGDDNVLLQDDNSSGSLSPSTNIPSKVTDCTEAGVTCDTWTPLPLVSTGTKSPAKGICYPCFVLDIFEEPPKPNVSLDPPTDQLNKAKQKYGEAAVETTVVEDEEEPICEKVLRKYVQRVGRAPSQCVRWGPGQEPLRSSCVPITVPKCPHCMSHRQFELQLTSPIIYFLTKGAEENDHSVHFGNVLVYTCSGNCNTQPYSLEYCFVEVEM